MAPRRQRASARSPRAAHGGCAGRSARRRARALEVRRAAAVSSLTSALVRAPAVARATASAASSGMRRTSVGAALAPRARPRRTARRRRRARPPVRNSSGSRLKRSSRRLRAAREGAVSTSTTSACRSRLRSSDVVGVEAVVDRPADRLERRRECPSGRAASGMAVTAIMRYEPGSPQPNAARTLLGRTCTEGSTQPCSFSHATRPPWSTPTRPCPAARRPSRSRTATSSTAASSSRRSPITSSRSSSAWAASGAPSASSGRPRASTRPPSATRAATRRTRPTRRSARGRTGHTEAVLVVFDPAVITLEEVLKAFWEAHDPTQGMRQGNDVGTQYRSAIYTTTDDAGAAPPRRRARRYAAGAAPTRATARSRPRSPPAGAVLLRRGLPPAVPREEPERVLRARRDGRLLPRRAPGYRVTRILSPRSIQS